MYIHPVQLTSALFIVPSRDITVSDMIDVTEYQRAIFSRGVQEVVVYCITYVSSSQGAQPWSEARNAPPPVWKLVQYLIVLP